MSNVGRGTSYGQVLTWQGNYFTWAAPGGASLDGYTQTSSPYGTGVGYQTRSSGSTGAYCAVYGYRAGYALTSGTYNTCCGAYSGDTLTTGNYNTIVGADADVAANSNAYSIVIGYGAVGKGSSIIVIGKTSTGAATEAWFHSEILRVGNEATGDKYIFFQRSSTAALAHPGFKYNETDDKLYWSHDGVTWNIFATAGASLTGYTETSGNFATALGFGTASSGSIVGTVCLGAYAGGLGASNASVHIGYYAGYRSIAPGGVFIGESAGRNLTVVGNTGNVCVGYQALQGANGVSIACNKNTVVGYQAGSGASYNALGNTLVGYQAGLLLSTGYNNTFIGKSTGTATTTGSGNVLIGNSVAAALTSGGTNIFLGGEACPTLQTGSSNIMLGLSTCDGMTDGTMNIALGRSSGPTTNRSNTTSIGQYAGQKVGQYSISIGERAAQNYGTGANAIAIGLNAADCFGAVTGVNNISIGTETHRGLATTAHNNIAIGYRAKHSGNGSVNIAIGYRAGYNESTSGAAGTILIGYDAGYRNQGNYNIAIGYQSMAQYATPALTGTDNVCIGRLSGAVISTGADNVFLGRSAGDRLETGSSNVCIGVSADTSGAGDSNEVVIGNGAVGKGSNTTVLGRSAATATTDTWLRGTTGHLGNETSGEDISFLFETTDNATRPGFQYQTGTGLVYYQNAGGSWASLDSLSDVRLKKNIEDLPYGLLFIQSLRPVLFDWKNPSGPIQARKQMGVVAQELKKSCEEAGFNPGLVDDSGKYLTVQYEQLVPALIKAVQELSSQVADLTKELAELKARS